MNKSPPLSSKFRNASGHLIPLLTKKWRVKLSSESVRHVQLLFLWDGRVASDTLIVVSWQLHNISWQQVVVSRSYIIYCQSKTVHRRFSFPRVAFLRRLCRPLLDILVTRYTEHFRCNGFYIQWIVSLNEFWFLFHRIRGTPALWKFWQSFTSHLEHISLCSLQPSNPKWIMLLNHTVFKSASAVELPKRSFSNRTWASSSLKAAEAFGLLPMPFRFRSLCFDWCAFQVSSN